MRVMMAAAAVLLSSSACGLEERERNPSCCFYECAGGVIVNGAQFFGTQEECRDLATSRCEFEAIDPGDEEVVRFEFREVELAPDAGLTPICDEIFDNEFDPD